MSDGDKRERELMAALAQMMVDKFHREYPEGTQPGDGTRLAMGYLNLLASVSAEGTHILQNVPPLPQPETVLTTNAVQSHERSSDVMREAVLA